MLIKRCIISTGRKAADTDGRMGYILTRTVRYYWIYFKTNCTTKRLAFKLQEIIPHTISAHAKICGGLDFKMI
jgi:hypothetical protein